MKKNAPLLLVAILSILLSACSAKDTAKDKKDSEKTAQKPTLVTVTQVKNQANRRHVIG